MRLYARGTRAVWQAASDIGIVLWLLLCWWAARTAHRVIDAVGTPSRRSGELLTQVITQLDMISRNLAKVPGVGDSMGLPFRTLSRLMWELVGQYEHQSSSVSSAADTISVLVFLIPALIMVALWLPRRVAFVQGVQTWQQFIDEDADLDLFALRAMAHLPMRDLAAVSSDPVGDWRQGDAEVIRRLAQLELERVGLRLPPRERTPRPTSSTSTGSPDVEALDHE